MRLTIRISDNSLSFSTPMTNDDGHIDYETFPVKAGISTAANLRLALAEGRLAGRGHKEAVVMTDSPVLLVPIEEYEENDITTLYSHVYGSTKSDTVMHTVLPGQNAVAAFAVNNDLRLVVGDNFAAHTFMPLMQPVWSYLHKRSFTGTRPKLFAHFHDRHVEVVGFRQNRFRFCNRFDATRYRDVAYYILYVWQQLGMDTQRDELHLSGIPDERDELLDMLRRCISNVYEINPAADLGYALTEGAHGMPLDLQIFYAKGR